MTIGILGLGYVGLPLAVEAARHFEVRGYDHNPARIAELRRGHDRTRQVDSGTLLALSRLSLTDQPEALRACTVFIVTVPTPVDAARQPDLRPLLDASRTVGRFLKKDDVVIYESTVYPGCTEDDCVPVLEATSGLRFNHDFTVGYSPERLSPGDRSRALPDIVKITAGSTPAAAERVDALYRQLVRAGTHRAPSIRVAEAAKLIENVQRDVNISLMNELVLLFDRLDLPLREVLAAAATKWNFLPFRPGLVGGHCISVDPYYLLHKAAQVGYSPEVVASGRRVNESMPLFVANKLMKLLVASGRGLSGARVLVLGVTYKENCPDTRDSKVVTIVRELQALGLHVTLHDPLADPADVAATYALTLSPAPDPGDTFDALLVAVAHADFQARVFGELKQKTPVVLDLGELWKA